MKSRKEPQSGVWCRVGMGILQRSLDHYLDLRVRACRRLFRDYDVTNFSWTRKNVEAEWLDEELAFRRESRDIDAIVIRIESLYEVGVDLLEQDVDFVTRLHVSNSLDDVFTKMQKDHAC